MNANLPAFTVLPLMVRSVVSPFLSKDHLPRAPSKFLIVIPAARLMGIDVDRVIGATFAIGGLLAGAASVIYGLTMNTVSFQMGYQNGLYAFTAAVLGGIGNLPGAMLGGIIIGLVRSLGSQYVGEQWTSALVFAILILLLVFPPSGLLGARTRDKV